MYLSNVQNIFQLTSSGSQIDYGPWFGKFFLLTCFLPKSLCDKTFVSNNKSFPGYKSTLEIWTRVLESFRGHKLESNHHWCHQNLYLWFQLNPHFSNTMYLPLKHWTLIWTQLTQNFIWSEVTLLGCPLDTVHCWTTRGKVLNIPVSSLQLFSECGRTPGPNLFIIVTGDNWCNENQKLKKIKQTKAKKCNWAQLMQQTNRNQCYNHQMTDLPTCDGFQNGGENSYQDQSLHPPSAFPRSTLLC